MRMSFLEAFSPEGSKDCRPVWLMRQAGRYLPEYQELRKKHSLLSCFMQPELAFAITHMPLKRFDLDAAILFSDLLVLLQAFGRTLVYPESGGLRVEPTLNLSQQLCLPTKEEIRQKLFYVFETISCLVPTLHVPLIGFGGAPFTLLCYLVEGRSGVGFKEIRVWIEQRKDQFLQALDVLCEASILFAELQIESGVQAFQVFDSWASLLSEEEFALYVIPYWKRMQQRLSHLRVPLIFFSRVNSLYPELISSIQPSCISFDEGKSLKALRDVVPSSITVQGNFSPELLLHASPHQIEKEALFMKEALKEDQRVIWNLGHGVLPKTPLKNVEALLSAWRK